jgi:glucose-1-phosphate thymidylyltransferase
MAGLGSRLRPHTWSKPKPLVGIAGKTLLDHVLDVVATAADLDECRLAFIVGYLGDDVRAHMAEYYPDVETHFYVQEEMLGQTHAIAMAREAISGPTMVMFIDTIVQTSLSFIKDPTQNPESVIWVKQVEDPRRFGVVSVGENGFVTEIIEKPDNFENDLAVVGYYYFASGEDFMAAIDRQLNDKMITKGEYYIADAIKLMIQDELKLEAKPVDVWLDAGLLDTVLESNRYLLERDKESNPLPKQNNGVKVVPPVFIHPEAEVTASVIGPYTSIGAGCKISYSKIENSVVEEDATIEISQLRDSLIGARSQVIGARGQLDIGDDSTVKACW